MHIQNPKLQAPKIISTVQLLMIVAATGDWVRRHYHSKDDHRTRATLSGDVRLAEPHLSSGESAQSTYAGTTRRTNAEHACWIGISGLKDNARVDLQLTCQAQPSQKEWYTGMNSKRDIIVNTSCVAPAS